MSGPMTIEEVESIESEASVTFALDWTGKPPAILTRGKRSCIDRAIELIAGRRDELADLLRKRYPEPPEPTIERIIPTNVPALAIQRATYVAWFQEKGHYYTPTEEELDKMFSVLEEGDLVGPDFAHSFSVKRANGLIIQVDRKGRISSPSPYSPVLAKK